MLNRLGYPLLFFKSLIPGKAFSVNPEHQYPETLSIGKGGVKVERLAQGGQF
jgi:hypothetical protein